MTTKSAALLSLATLLPLFPPASAKPLEVLNAGLEEPYKPIPRQADTEATGEVADGWFARPQGPARFSRETDSVVQGKSAQRVELFKFNGRQTEIGKRLSLSKNTRHRFTLWLKGDNFTSVQLLLRDARLPYATTINQKLELSPEWKAFEVTGEASADDMFLVVAMHAPGAVWLDNLQIETAESVATEKTQAATLNLVGNSSFEAGASGGWRILIRSGDGFDQVARREYSAEAFREDVSAFAGEKSLVIPLDTGLAAVVTSPSCKVERGSDYTASIAVKADSPSEFELVLSGVEGPDGAKSVKIRPSSSWQRFSVSGKAASDWMQLTLKGAPSGKIDLSIDAAQLEKGSSATAYQPAFPVELGLELPRPGSIVFNDDTDTAMECRAEGPIPAGAHFKITSQNLMRGTRREELLTSTKLSRVRLTLPGGNEQGIFKVRALLEDSQGKPLSSAVEKTFARLPHPRDVAPDQSYFGIHVPLKPVFLDTAVALGNKWIRLHDASWVTKWAAVQPVEGPFVFADDGVDAAKARGLAILGMLDGAPPWTSVKPAATRGYFSAYNVPDRADGNALWSRYVKETVSHYAGRIDAWEVWNEPWGKGFFPGTPEQYGELLNLAYPAAKEANPRAIILGFSSAGHKIDWTKAALNVVRPGNFDVFSFHDYNPGLYGGPDNNALRLARRFSDIQGSDTPRPLWDTECGPGHVASAYAQSSGKAVSLRAQMTHIVRFDVTQIAAGVRRLFYYSLHSLPAAGEESFIGLEHDGSIRPIMASRAILASMIDGATFDSRFEPQPGVEGYVFKHNGERVTVLWRYGPGSDGPWSIPGGSSAFDLMGNPLPGTSLTFTADPVYLKQARPQN